MTTATASRPVRMPTTLLVVLTAVVGIAAGGLLGYGLAARSWTSGPTPAVVADNATVDALFDTMATGSVSEIEGLLLPTFTFTSTSVEPTKNATGMRIAVTDWQGAGVRPVRTTDVARADDVLFVGGRYEYADGTPIDAPFTWTIRLAVDGARLASIHETLH